MHSQNILSQRSLKRRRASAEEEPEEDNTETKTVKVLYNHIYYYGPVNRESVCNLCEEIKKLEIKLTELKQNYELQKYPKIFIHIQSEGGDALAGLAAMDVIRASKLKIVTIVEGYAASAASFIMLGGDERRILKHSNVLIHEIKTEFWGKFQELKDEMYNCDKLMDTIRKLYKEKTKIPTKKLAALLKKDLYLDADECLEYGIVDEII